MNNLDINELERENEQLKEFLAEAIDIANFTTHTYGFFINQRLWKLKINIVKSQVSIDNNHLHDVINADH